VIGFRERPDLPLGNGTSYAVDRRAAGLWQAHPRLSVAQITLHCASLAVALQPDAFLGYGILSFQRAFGWSMPWVSPISPSFS
jgi:hypothetical protein